MLHLLSVPAHASVVAGLALRLPVLADDAGANPDPNRFGRPSQPERPDNASALADQQFMDMLKAYRPSGGLLRAPNVAARCKPRSGTDVATLAAWMVHRQVVCVEWLSRIWLPVFQFHRADMSRLSGLDEVVSELVEVYDDWQLARWFSLPNQWLGHALPADRLASAAAEVLSAARAEHFEPSIPPLRTTE